MRKLYSLLLIAFCFIALIKVNAQTVFLEEGFENGIPTTWVNTSISGTQIWNVSTNSSFEGSKSAYLESGFGRVSRLVTPVLNLYNAEEPVRLSFYYKLPIELSKNDSLVVLYRTSPSASWNELGTLNFGTRQYEYQEYVLPNLTDTYQVAFRAHSSENGGVFVDNVKIFDSPLCAQPTNIYLTNGNVNSATINWMFASYPGIISEDYELKVSTTPISNLRNTHADVFDGNIVSTTNSHPINNLNPNTSYYVYLRSNCVSNYKGYSKWTSFSFKTPCVATNLPFVENFDNVTTSTMPGCWFKSESNATDIGVVNSLFSGSAGKSLRIRSASNAYVVIPATTQPGNDMELSFKMYSNTQTGMEVLLTSDPFDISMATMLQTVGVSKNNTWEDMVVYTDKSNVTEANQYFVFYLPATENTSTVYIDNIEIKTMPTCPRPFNLTFENIEDGSVELSWEEWGTATSWVVEYSSADGVYTTNATTNNKYLLTGLSGNTDYTVRVKAACGGDFNTHAISFKTKCGFAEIPFVENFDGQSTIPACWSNAVGTTTMEIYRWNLSSEGFSGGAIRFNSEDNIAGNTNVLKTPRFDLSAVNGTAILQFKYLNKRGGDLSVFVSTDGGITYNNVVATGLKSTDYWVDAEYSLAAYASQSDVVVAFVGTSNEMTDGFINIDDVAVIATPDCMKPQQLIFSDITSTSIKLDWTPKGNESEWTLKYKINDGAITTVAVSSTPNYTISNLSPETVHLVSVWIAANCSTSEISADLVAMNHEFTTRCESVAVPYVENFDTYSEGDFPSCWEFVWSVAVTNPTKPQVYRGAQEGVNNSLRLFDNSIIAMPEFEEPVQSLRLKFGVKSNNFANNLEVGVISDLADPNSFVPIQTITGLSNVSTATLVTVNFDTYTGNGKYIAFRNSHPSDNFAVFYIDNVGVSVIPACDDIEDNTWQVLSQSGNSAKVRLNDNTVVNWQVQYDIAGFTIETGTILTANSVDSLVIPNLEASTVYDFYIRKDCGSGVYGAWSSAKTIKTSQIPATIPFFESFETDEANEWTLENGTAVNAWTVGAATASNGNKSLYISEDGGANSSYNVNESATVWAYRTINFPEAGSYLLTYDWMAGGEDLYADYDFLRAYLIPNSVVLNAGIDQNSSFNIPEGWIPVDSGRRLKMSDTWKQLKTEITISSPQSYHLAFLWVNDGMSGNQPGAVIDNIVLEQIACPRPILDIATQITSNSAVLNWVDSENSYQVLVLDEPMRVEDVDFNGSSVIEYTTVSTNSYPLSLLQENTKYYFYVRAICTNENSGWSKRGEFKTECEPLPLPYIETFEDSDSKLDCWLVTNGSVDVSSTYKMSGNKSGYIQGGTTAVLPRLDVVSLASYQISAYTYSTTDSASINLGVMLDPNDISTYEPIANIKLQSKNSWSELVAYFSILNDPDYAAVIAAKYIVIDVPNGSNIYVDNIEVNVIPNCPKPSQLTVHNVTGSSANLSWVGNGESSWQLKVTNNNVVLRDTIVVNPSFLLENLDGNSEYSYAVRAICAIGDTSDWAVNRFTTLCGYIAIPYIDGFENYTNSTYTETEAIPDCWTILWHMADYESRKPQIYYSSMFSAEGNYTFGAKYQSLVALPAIAAPLNTLRMNFTFKTGSADSYIVVGVVENMQDTSSFVPVRRINGLESVLNEQRVSVSFENYTGVGKNIAVKFGNIYNYEWLQAYIDEVVIDELPPCSDIQKENWTISTMSQTEIRITKTDDSVEDFDIEYGLKGFNLGEGTQLLAQSGDSVTVTGLTHSSNYDIYIRKNCGNGLVGAWTLLKTIATYQMPATLPFYATFENGTEGFSFENDKNGWFVGGAAAKSGNVGLYISEDNGITNTYNNSVISFSHAYRVLSLDAEKNYLLQFDWKSNGNNSDDLLHAFLVPGNLTLQAGNAYGMEYSNYSPSDWIDLGGVLHSSTNWQTKSVVIDNLPSSGNYQLLFFWKNSDYAWGSNPPAAIDNVLFDEISCLPPSVDVANVESNSVELIIAQTDDVSSFRILVTDSPLVNGIATSGSVVRDLIISGNNTFVLAGLTENTEYYVYAKAICAVGDSSMFSAAKTFVTTCLPLEFAELPYTESFDSYTAFEAATGLVPDCWRVVTASGSANDRPQIYSDSYSATSGDNSFRMNMDALVALREINVPLTNVQIKFKLKGNEDATIEVGVMDNLNDASSFVSVASFVPKSMSNTQIVNAITRFTTYEGAGKIIAIRYTGNYLESYIDDVVIEELPACANPIKIHIAKATHNSITVNWDKYRDTDSQWELLVKPNGIAQSTIQVSGTPSHTITGLSPNTSYTIEFKVKLLPCATEYYTENITVSTTCSPILLTDLPYRMDFEDLSSYDGNTGVIPPCWSVVWMSKPNSYSKAQVVGDDFYSSTGRYSFMMFDESLVALPAIDVPINELTLNFNYKAPMGGCSLIVGVMDNVSDKSSFVPVDTIISENMSFSTIAAQVYFDNYSGLGKYIALKNVSTSGNNPTYYIDDILIEKAPTCKVPEKMKFAVTNSKLQLTWNASSQNEWTIKLTNDKTNAVTYANVTGQPVYQLSGLSGSTGYNYTVELRTVCAVGDTSLVNKQKIEFTTLCDPFELPYREDFSGQFAPDCWKSYTGLFRGQSVSTNNLEELLGWSTITNGNGLPSIHPILRVYNDATRYWLVTPLFNVENNSQLTFDLALTQDNSAAPILDRTGQLDDRFMVVVSEDAGLTWNLTNATVWDNAGSSHVYNNIPSKGEKIRIALGDYAGKTIQIAFYGESTTQNYSESNDIHIDNVSVGCDGGELFVNDVICSGYDYVGHGFNIAKEKLHTGLNTFSYIKEALNNEVCDTVFTLHLIVNPENVISINDTICAGMEYDENGFIGLKTQGIYTHVYTNAVGCDSIVRLTLKVFQITETITKTICEGDTYNFGSDVLTGSGIYQQKLTNLMGCDSIVTLYLRVIPSAVTITKDLCEGGTFLLGDSTLNTTGRYVRNLKNVLGCDSLVTVDLTIHASQQFEMASICLGQSYTWKDTILTTSGNYKRELLNPAGCKTTYHIAMTVLQPDTLTIYDSVCEGAGYNNHGFVNLHVLSDSVLYERLISSAGCDSINKIYLSVVPTVFVTEKVTVSSDDLPYNWNNNSLMTSGTYGPIRLMSEVTGCDSIVTLELTVQTEVDNYMATRTFVISPNPVQRNMPAVVNYEFTDAERNGLKVQVINSVGQIIQNFSPTSYPVQVEQVATSGYYMIRIVTGVGTKYHGNLIVK